ncbi:ankyrin repeat-containing domain protein [Mycena floridula]|nr:ankyrin repeat-containing domain protein [Mycena floridula]
MPPPTEGINPRYIASGPHDMVSTILGGIADTQASTAASAGLKRNTAVLLAGSDPEDQTSADIRPIKKMKIHGSSESLTILPHLSTTNMHIELLELIDKISSHVLHLTPDNVQVIFLGRLSSFQTIMRLIGHRFSHDAVLQALTIKLRNITSNLNMQHLEWPFSAQDEGDILADIAHIESLLTLGQSPAIVAVVSEDVNETGLHDAKLSTTGHGSSIQINAQGVHLGSVGGSAFSHNIIHMGDPDLTKRVIGNIRGVGKEVRNISDTLTPMVEKVQLHLMSDDMRKFTDWLSCLDFQTTQQHLISQWTPGTVDWFIENEKFQDWTAGKFGVLWCPGEPGVGKTILASRVIDHLHKVPSRCRVGVAYIFFRYNEANTQDITALVASILGQLLIGNTIPDWLKPLYDSFKDKRLALNQDLETLVNALDSQIQEYSDVYLVVDAFDECMEDIREDFLSTFRPLADSNRLRILVTSRPLLSIENDDDVCTHILDQIRKHKRLEKLVKGDQTRFEDEIVEQIIEKAAGMFLLVHLHLESLKNKPNRQRLREALAKLPDKIYISYDETMHRINSQEESSAQLANQVFKWLVYAKRPLSMLELRHALAISLESTEMDPDAITSAEILIEICGGLVVMEKDYWGTDSPRLVHYMTKEYLELKAESLFPDAHLGLATACLKYLCFDTLDSKVWRIDKYPDPDKEPYVLAQYAADHWGDHGRECEDQLFTDHKGLLLQFLQHDRIPCSWKSYDDEWQLQWGNGLGSLGRFGLSKLLKSILDDSTIVNDPHGLGYALYLAVCRNHATIVRLLVMRATLTNQIAKETTRACIIDPNISYCIHSSLWERCHPACALAVAARVGSVEFVTLLLRLPGLNPNVSDDDGCTPLHNAAGRGHVEVVALLMQHADIDVNSADKQGETPLHQASSNGHQKTVELLLGHPEIQPNLPNCYGVLPWMEAAQEGHQSIVELFLARDDIDPNGQDEEFLTPLSHAAANSYVRLMQYLLSLPQVNFATSFNMAYAARGGRKAVIDLLCERDDLNPNVQSYRSRGPLSWAAAEGHIEWVEFLLQLPGINPDLKDEMESQTPLLYAADADKANTMRILMQCNDVDLNSQDKHGRTPLSYAASYYDLFRDHNATHSVALLLAHPNIQPDCPDYTGRTPLSYAAASYLSKEVVALLVQREDVDINSQDVYGRTPLSYASEKGREKTALHLLDLPGIHANLADRRGITPLMYSAMEGGYDNTLFKRLLNHDAVDRNQLDFQGRTLLMFCAMARYEETAQYLLDNYVMDVNTKSKGLQTALSIAVGKPNLDVASLLLSRGDVDCNVRDRHGRTPLYIAVESLHRKVHHHLRDWHRAQMIKMIDLLRQYGAEEDGPDLLQCLNDVECNEIWDCLYSYMGRPMCPSDL